MRPEATVYSGRRCPTALGPVGPAVHHGLVRVLTGVNVYKHAAQKKKKTHTFSANHLGIDKCKDNIHPMSINDAETSLRSIDIEPVAVQQLQPFTV